MKCDSYSCVGESHIASGKPCQDSSSHHCDEKNDIYVVVVCDGHGGDRYFRSDIGSRLLCNITKENLIEFAEIIKKRNKKSKAGLFVGKPFIQVPTIRESTDALPRQNEEDKVLTQLFSSIVTTWKESISEHASRTPLSDWEIKNVKPEYLTDFENGKSLEKVYGSTLMAYLQTKDFWLAFHLGDGKCIMFDDSDQCIEPVLWDEKCFLNRTTSICDPAPIEEIRYSYRGDGVFPFAVFLGSDGIDDSFGDGERLHGFYLNILRSIVQEGAEAVHKSLVESLPIISKRGSQDDMSVAYAYDEKELEQHVISLTNNQIDTLNIRIAEIDQKIYAKAQTIDELGGQYESKRAQLAVGDNKSQEYKNCEKIRINLKYAKSEYDDLRVQRESIIKQLSSLMDFVGTTPKSEERQISIPKYLAKIISFISGDYGKKCDEENDKRKYVSSAPVEIAINDDDTISQVDENKEQEKEEEQEREKEELSSDEEKGLAELKEAKKQLLIVMSNSQNNHDNHSIQDEPKEE